MAGPTIRLSEKMSKLQGQTILLSAFAPATVENPDTEPEA